MDDDLESFFQFLGVFYALFFLACKFLCLVGNDLVSCVGLPSYVHDTLS